VTHRPLSPHGPRSTITFSMPFEGTGRVRRTPRLKPAREAQIAKEENPGPKGAVPE
jgi:hypothetical protein